MSREILDSFPHSELVDIKREYKTGQSGALVFAAQYKPHNQYGLQGAFIIKIGSVTWACEEERLYKKLSGSALAPLLTEGHMSSTPVGEQAAVAYGIAFNSLLMTQPLTDVLDGWKGLSEEETQNQIKNLVQTLVNWYRNENIADDNVVEDPHTLLMRMLTPRRTSDLLARLKEALPNWRSDTFQITVRGLNSRLPNPLAYMEKTTWQKMKVGNRLQCLLGRIHGDLHTGNIICSPTQSLPKIIDFEQSEEKGVPFFDLAYLEFDIMRNLLPIEKEENREHWLSLLNFSMAGIEGGAQDPSTLSWDALRAWNLIKPIRQEAQQLQSLGKEDYKCVWWLATMAAGLNFARKGKLGRSQFERTAGLLYAAYGLARVLHELRAKEVMMEQTSFVPWLPGEEDPLPTELEDTSAKETKRIQNLLEKSFERFNMGEPIWREGCDAASSALQHLETYLRELNKSSVQKPYQIRFLPENILKLQKNTRSAIQSFREICIPLNNGKRHQIRYNKERVAIANNLKEILDSFLELLKNLE